MVTYMMRELTENITGQQELVDELDWYIVPCVNPDGYAYTWSDDRLWRKTRHDARGIYNIDQKGLEYKEYSRYRSKGRHPITICTTFSSDKQCHPTTNF